MFEERRNLTRVNTHIVAEINVQGNPERLCGYIENISEKGIGVLSLDPFIKGAEAATTFQLPGIPRSLEAKVSLLNSKSGLYNLYYHSFRFEGLSESEQMAICHYIKQQESVENPA